MPAEKQNKKTAEEGKNVKAKKSGDKKLTPVKSSKTKTTERPDVNSDVDQE